MNKNYFDAKGNYINVENLSLAQIYRRGAEENKQHGAWALDGTDYYCNRCDTLAPKGRTDTDARWFPIRYDFCPNCGADMREPAEPPKASDHFPAVAVQIPEPDLYEKSLDAAEDVMHYGRWRG